MQVMIRTCLHAYVRRKTCIHRHRSIPCRALSTRTHKSIALPLGSPEYLQYHVSCNLKAFIRKNSACLRNCRKKCLSQAHNRQPLDHLSLSVSQNPCLSRCVTLGLCVATQLLETHHFQPYFQGNHRAAAAPTVAAAYRISSCYNKVPNYLATTTKFQIIKLLQGTLYSLSRELPKTASNTGLRRIGGFIGVTQRAPPLPLKRL